jgi:hypothetical protein
VKSIALVERRFNLENTKGWITKFRKIFIQGTGGEIGYLSSIASNT